MSALALARAAHSQVLNGTVQSEIILFKNSQNPLAGTVPGANWAWPGTALSANTHRLHANYLASATLRFARWVLVWNPQVTDPVTFSPTGVRLVKFDDGPTNIEEVAAVRSPQGTTYATPRVDAVDVTSALQQIVSALTTKQIGQQTFGNGQNGCLIYGSWLELVWG
jgi:hypothetical protein